MTEPNFSFLESKIEQAMQAEAPFKLVTGEALYLTGKTLRLLAAEHECFYLFDKDGTVVLDSEFYVVSCEGIERIKN